MTDNTIGGSGFDVRDYDDSSQIYGPEEPDQSEAIGSDGLPGLDESFDAQGNYSHTGDNGESTLQMNADGSIVSRNFEEDGSMLVRTGDGRLMVGDLNGSLNEGTLSEFDSETLAAYAGPDGTHLDVDGDSINETSVVANEDGSVTVTDWEEGTVNTVGADNSIGYRDENGEILQANADGSFIHQMPDGSSTWRTADGQTGQTIINEQGQPFSVVRDPDGSNGRVLGSQPYGGLMEGITLPGLDAPPTPDGVTPQVFDDGTVWNNEAGDHGVADDEGGGVRINADGDGDPNTAPDFYQWDGAGNLTWRTEEGGVGELTDGEVTYVNEHGHTYSGSADSLLSHVAPELVDPGFRLGAQSL